MPRFDSARTFPARRGSSRPLHALELSFQCANHRNCFSREGRCCRLATEGRPPASSSASSRLVGSLRPSRASQGADSFVLVIVAFVMVTESGVETEMRIPFVGESCLRGICWLLSQAGEQGGLFHLGHLFVSGPKVLAPFSSF